MNVSDIMSSHVICVGQDESVGTAARLLKRYNLGALPVCDSSGRLRGVVTDRDIVLRCVAPDGDPARLRVSEIMSRGVVTAGREEDMGEVSRRMAARQLRRIPVTEEGRIVGLVSLCDLARRADCRMEAGDTLGAVSANLRTL